MAIYPVILCGGIGSRLWPTSRAHHPKQLLSLHSEQSLLVETALRVVDENFASPLIICNHEYRFMVAEQLRNANVTPSTILLEPDSRNTAPAAAGAALKILETDPNALLLIMPSDHLIANVETFRSIVKDAAQIAKQNHLVTFGVTPTKPDTKYGYIQAGESLSQQNNVYQIKRFVEKPNRETAENFLNEKNYFWNSGIFLFPAALFIEELIKFEPNIVNFIRESLIKAKPDLDFYRLDAENFKKSPSISIDYAVMEHTRRAAVVPIDIGWSDIGSWDTLWEIGEKDKDGNVTVGDVLTQNVKNSYIRSDNDLLTTVLGLDDIIVITTDDAVLVASRDQVVNIKEMITTLKTENREERLLHSTVYRPWGNYRVIKSDNKFRVKQITINLKASLSLQYHQHRAEHWVVVEGTAQVTCGEKTFLLNENQSTYIPSGEIHRIENAGEKLLKIIEIQSGTYLGEDDIVRLEDHYNRNH